MILLLFTLALGWLLLQFTPKRAAKWQRRFKKLRPLGQHLRADYRATKQNARFKSKNERTFWKIIHNLKEDE